MPARNVDEFRDVSRRFWTRRGSYPAYDHVGLRHEHDLKYLETHLDGSRIVTELGCGDGHLACMIARSHPALERFQLFDYSPGLVEMARKSWNSEIPMTCSVGDLRGHLAGTEADFTLSMGVLCFMFTETDLEGLFRNVRSLLAVFRTPCTLEEEDEWVNTYSETLKAPYACLYRTVGNTRKILERRFEVVEVRRSWPDEIESKFGTRQFNFLCRDRRGKV